MRLAALAWLLGPAVLGAAAVISMPFRVLVWAAAAATACWAARVAARGSLADTRHAHLTEPGCGPIAESGGAHPSVDVVVAARDEAAVLPGLLADLGSQDLRTAEGEPLFDVFLIDDHSIDETFDLMEAACLAGTVPVARAVALVDGQPDGKGSALRAIPPSILTGDVVCILDADARIHPSFLRTAWTEARGHPALTARRRILGRAVSRWAALQDDEQTVDAFIQRGRWALGGCAEFRGDGMVVERRLLEESGGWAARCLTEDLDLSTRLAATGFAVAPSARLVVSEAPVLGLRAFRHQRMRWAEGSIRRYLAHGEAVLRSPRLSVSARLEFAIYAGLLAVPQLLLGALAAGILRRRPAVPAGLAGAYLAGGALLAYRALSCDPDRGPATRSLLAARAVLMALFGAAWGAVVPAALVRLAVRRGPPTHVPTPHFRA